MTPLRICFVAPKCYDLLARAARPRYFGGAERQQVLLAQGLAARGHAISFVTLDYGQPDGVVHDGIQVFKSYSPSDGVPGIRFLHPRWSGLARAMRRADADVFYQMGGDSETGQVAASCQMHGRSFVFCAASDADADPSLPLLGSRRQRVLYRAGLRRADGIVAQTDTQRDRLRDAFSVESVVIRNCTADPGFTSELSARVGTTGRPRLLWVGRFVRVKRLELLLDLAEAHPDWDFHVIGGGDAADQYVRGLEARAAGIANVTRHGRVGDAELHEQYLHASALLCTSSMEGVPTTFLEGWARGVPVVSTVDPDDVIARYDLGAVATAESLADGVRMVVAQHRPAVSRRVREYFLRTHTIDAYVSQHEQLFASHSRT
jgi:glycosyltransferase involved in cell wall biosynthesis